MSRQDALVEALGAALAAALPHPLIVDEATPLTMEPGRIWAGLMLSDSAPAQISLLEAELGTGLSGEPGLYEIAPELVLRVAAATRAERRRAIDPLIEAARTALQADPTLGGLAVDVAADAPRRDLAQTPGQIPVEETTVPIRIAFYATDPLE